jgi:hypothetical protein
MNSSNQEAEDADTGIGSHRNLLGRLVRKISQSGLANCGCQISEDTDLLAILVNDQMEQECCDARPRDPWFGAEDWRQPPETDRRDGLVKLELPRWGGEAGETGQVFRQSIGRDFVGRISAAHPPTEVA